MNKCLIWGTGKKAEQNFKKYLLASLDKYVEIIGFIDNDPEKYNECFHGIKIYKPSDIGEVDYHFIDIWVIKEYEEIKSQIYVMDIPNKRIASIFQYFIQKVINRYIYTSDDEIKSFLSIMKQKNELCVYAYTPVNKEEIREAYYDQEEELYYVWFEGKRLYLARNYGFTVNNGKKYVSNLWQEQDLNSPHLYEENEIIVKEGDVLVDVGVREGNFSLHNIDKVKKLYLIECDLNWMEALKATFKPYSDKVIFCNQYISAYDTATTTTLNTLVQEPVDFLKMDIEGEEINALIGSDKMFAASENIKCSICCYHRHDDENKIKKILQQYGLNTSTSRGYMLFIYDDEVWKEPELRRGVVRGKK